MKREKRIVLYPKKSPSTDNVNYKIQYFGHCFGLFGLRDKDSSCFRIFVELVKRTKGHNEISSQELAYKLNLTRGTVVHHLNKLMDAGMVITKNSRYSLREQTLNQVVNSIEDEVTALIRDLKKVANELDDQLGLKD